MELSFAGAQKLHLLMAATYSGINTLKCGACWNGVIQMGLVDNTDSSAHAPGDTKLQWTFTVRIYEED